MGGRGGGSKTKSKSKSAKRIGGGGGGGVPMNEAAESGTTPEGKGRKK